MSCVLMVHLHCMHLSANQGSTYCIKWKTNRTYTCGKKNDFFWNYLSFNWHSMWCIVNLSLCFYFLLLLFFQWMQPWLGAVWFTQAHTQRHWVNRREKNQIGAAFKEWTLWNIILSLHFTMCAARIFMTSVLLDVIIQSYQFVCGRFGRRHLTMENVQNIRTFCALNAFLEFESS